MITQESIDTRSNYGFGQLKIKKRYRCALKITEVTKL